VDGFLAPHYENHSSCARTTVRAYSALSIDLLTFMLGKAVAQDPALLSQDTLRRAMKTGQETNKLLIN
jgi:hypothetical protein